MSVEFSFIFRADPVAWWDLLAPKYIEIIIVDKIKTQNAIKYFIVFDIFNIFFKPSYYCFWTACLIVI